MTPFLPTCHAVMKPVAVSLIMQFSGDLGYPADLEGVDRLADALAEVSVSVDHARAILTQFDCQCPTADEIRKVAERVKPVPKGKVMKSQPHKG